MRLIVPLLALCASACSPSGAEVVQQVSQTPTPQASQTPTRTYASQLEAPSPNYKAMLAGSRPQPIGEMQRPASAKLPADAKAIGALWIALLEGRKALMGHGLAGKSEDGPVNHIDTLLTAREFDAWVAENGWQVPRHISWHFQNELVAPRISEAAAAKVRVWPASTTRTGWQLEAAEGGRVFVRDGCFYVRRFDGSEKLAWFHAETGLAVDGAGYLTFIDRANGQPTGRLGEEMTWAGPNHVPGDDPALAELRKACGPGEVHGVGNPQAQERMYVQYPHLRNPAPPPPPPPPRPPAG